MDGPRKQSQHSACRRLGRRFDMAFDTLKLPDREQRALGLATAHWPADQREVQPVQLEGRPV